MQGVYWIRNKKDGKRYIGSTNDFEKGWKERLKALRKEKHHNIRLQRAWNKHREENFVFEIVEKVKGNRTEVYNREQYYLDLYWTTGFLYNLKKEAVGGSGPKSKESRAKLSKAMSGKNNPMYGKPQTEEHKRNKREGSLRYYETHDGYWLGKHRSEETCNKIGKTQQGREITWGDKISKALVGNTNGMKSYPAFYNEKTGECIPPGINLHKMCEEYGLQYLTMHFLKHKRTKQSRAGWSLANGHSEIKN